MRWCTVNKLQDYFHTDWGAMTLHDWLGLGITIVVFAIMLALYLYIFNPANKERLEAARNIPLDDEHNTSVKPERTPELTTKGKSTEGQ
jgi:cytochrome c oxidase cbb3-type subunit 4